LCGSSRNFEDDDDELPYGEQGESGAQQGRRRAPRGSRDDVGKRQVTPTSTVSSGGGARPLSPYELSKSYYDRQREEQALLFFPFSPSTTPTSTVNSSKLASKPPRPRGSTPIRPSDCVPVDRMNASCGSKRYEQAGAVMRIRVGLAVVFFRFPSRWFHKLYGPRRKHKIGELRGGIGADQDW
jgi:hypothetical protein